MGRFARVKEMVSDFHIPKLSGMQSFKAWKRFCRQRILAAPNYPHDAALWFYDIFQKTSYQELESSGFFQQLDTKFADKVTKIVDGAPELEMKKIELEFEEQDKYLNGREMIWITWSFHKVNSRVKCNCNVGDLLEVKYRGDLTKFYSEWQELLIYQDSPPTEELLEALLRPEMDKNSSWTPALR